MKIEHKTEKIKLIKTRLSSRKILTLSHLSNPCLSSFFQSCNTYARKPTQINTKYLISYLTFPIHPVISLSSRVMAGTRALEAESPFPVPLRLAVRLWRDTAIPWNSVSSSVKWACWRSLSHSVIRVQWFTAQRVLRIRSDRSFGCQTTGGPERCNEEEQRGPGFAMLPPRSWSRYTQSY